MVGWLPIILPATAVFYALVAQSLGVRRKAKARAAAAARGPTFLVHSINDERCTGCETCVQACPTNVLALVGHKSRAVAFEHCVQCERCARVCPTNALVMHRLDEAPPRISVPELDANFQTRVPGQYLIGEVAGKPLVKNAANLGRLVVEHIVAGSLMPRTLGVPGENLPKVLSMLERAAEYAARSVLVVGGGDSALEAACALADAGARVTMSYRRDSFGRAKPANAKGVAEHAAAGRIVIHFSSVVAAITEKHVELTLKDGATERLPNDACFVLIGADRPVKWLARVGVAFVERPHTFELGRSDALVEEICGPQHECPRDAAAAFSAVTGRVPSARIPLATATPRPAPKRRASTMGSPWSGIKRMATDRFHRPSQDELDEVVVVARDPLSARRALVDDIADRSLSGDLHSPLDDFDDGPTMVQSSPFLDGPTSVTSPARF